ncbi:MAG: hypothetical protein K0S53_378 [Bacteroidetes bacterium]|jgi:hypothetical protein|nr:hypothetical protein [Bacteroidota bacterium]
MSKEKWYNHPWLLAIFAVVGPGIYDLIKGYPFLDTYKKIINFLYIGISTFFNFNIKLWWLLLAIVIYKTISFLIKKYRTKEKDFKDYTSGTLKNWKWSWEWTRPSVNSNWIVSNLTPHCSANGMCDTQMLRGYNRQAQIEYKCPRCGHNTGNNIEYERDIEALIIDNIQKKNF